MSSIDFRFLAKWYISLNWIFIIVYLVLIFPLLFSSSKTPTERLGCHHESGFNDIQSHPFFRAIQWDMLEQKLVTPPYKPSLKSDRDLEHFDPAFTDEPVQLTPDDPWV